MASNKIEYQFTAIPTQLFLCLDNNCRSTLFSLIQLSTYFESKKGAAFDGWFFRTNALLEEETNLSKNVLSGALDALYQAGIIDIKAQEKGRGKSQGSRSYKVIYEAFLKFQSIPIDECSCSHPDFGIVTSNYKKGAPSFQKRPQLEKKQKCGKSDNNKDYLDNKEKIDTIDYSIKSLSDIKSDKDINNSATIVDETTNGFNCNSYSSSYNNHKKPVLGNTKEEEPGQEKVQYQVSSFNSKVEEDYSKYGERPRQEEKQGSKESDFLRSITLEDDFETPSTPPDERYWNYVGNIQDYIRLGGYDYDDMTDEEMAEAITEDVDSAIEQYRRRGKTQRFQDHVERAKQTYMRIYGCSDEEALRVIRSLYQKRQKEYENA